jgi:hypothetical protein
MQRAKIDLQVFDIKDGIDFYSLPDLAKTMATCRYSLIEEIMEFKLLSLKDVLGMKIEIAEEAILV